ncbi:MAG: mechanosensitive ion channel family protein [Candidatus Hydrothermarchaeota archaeon]|nr:mechanosensitive ion channel family protein [Candidatus Hydrothermarchaeota archaeon]
MNLDISFLYIAESVYLNTLLILAAFVVLAKLVDIFFEKFLLRLTSQTKFEFDDRILKAAHKPVFQTIVIVGALFAVAYLNPPAMPNFYITAALKSFILIIWGATVFRLMGMVFTDIARKITDVTGLGGELIPLFENLAKIFLVGAGLMIFLSLWNVDITPLLATAGIAGLVVAFAAKDTIANFFGGISVFMDRPYKVGDYIILDSGERGEVAAIGMRSTRIKTRDDVLITIPNSIMANTKIINESAPIPRFRLRVPIGVAYGSDVDKVEEVLIKIAEENEHVCKELKPRVRFRSFGDSSFNFELLCWVDEPMLKGRVLHQINKAIYKRFKEEGITIPFPQRDIHIYNRGGE